MSTLKPEDRSSRARSRSRSGRDRSRSRSNVRAPEAPEAPRTSSTSYVYPQQPTNPVMPGSFGNDAVTSPAYDVRAPMQAKSSSYSQPNPPASYFPAGSTPSQYPPPPPAQSVPYPQDRDDYTMGGYTDLPPHERPGYQPQAAYMPPPPPMGRHRTDSSEEDLAYGSEISDTRGRQQPSSRNNSYSNPSSGYRYAAPPGTDSRHASNAQQYQYAQPPEKITYSAKPHTRESRPESLTYNSAQQGHYQPPVNYSSNQQGQYREQLPRKYSDPYSRETHDITPGRDTVGRHNSIGKVHRLSVDPSSTSTALMAPGGLGPRMDRLSVSGNRPDPASFSGGGMAPPSPMLEAYRGTYQSISPMPTAIRPDDDLDLEDLPPLSAMSTSRGSGGNDRLAQDLAKKEKKKRVQLYDPEDDAKKIASALSHSKIDADGICDVLPGLSHDQIVEVRKEYKKQVKVQGKGVNLSKHINMKLSGNFGKAVYVTALGRYESEGYWANFFYQSHSSRRELLIESLMGRTNADIRMIKDEFKDKRYSDSLTKCMEKELKMDKFRTAVLMVLEERRQEEQDVYPMEYVHRDVDMLYRSLNAERGGESAMLEIIVRRSDAHLKQVLEMYQRTYNENFARAALQRSNNLVGEILTHILNGAINRPARDALLLHHAISDVYSKNREDDLRYELLISRLVRMHWDKTHLVRVKKQYYTKYGTALEDAVAEATKGDFREFMCELCETPAGMR